MASAWRRRRALAHPLRLAARVRLTWRPGIWLVGGAAALAATWGLACGATYFYSRECRRELIAAITKLTAAGRPNSEALRSPQLFSVMMRPGRDDRPAGFLLRIAAGPGPSSLQCRRIAHESANGPARLFFARHRLRPGREQCFFVTCRPGTAFGDPRLLALTALLDGDARFLSCARVDLSGWRRLPVSTVFVPGECDPGSPVVGGRTGETQYAANRDLNDAGLSFDELVRYGGTPADLSASEGGTHGAPTWRPVGEGRAEPSAEGLRVRTPDQPDAYAAETQALTAPADGMYYFRLRYRPVSGRLTFGVLAQSRQSWLAIRWWDDPAGADVERIVQVQLRAGQVFSLVAANGAAGRGSEFILEGLTVYRDVSGE